MKRVLFLLVSIALAILSGCSDGGEAPPEKAQVSGTVTLDGTPMTGGEVRFNVVGQPAVSLEVKNGSFSGDVFTGENRVDVVWEKEGAPHPMDPNQRLMENVVDAKFSGPNTPFKPVISKEGANDLTFAVTSKR